MNHFPFFCDLSLLTCHGVVISLGHRATRRVSADSHGHPESSPTPKVRVVLMSLPAADTGPEPQPGARTPSSLPTGPPPQPALDPVLERSGYLERGPSPSHLCAVMWHCRSGREVTTIMLDKGADPDPTGVEPRPPPRAEGDSRAKHFPQQCNGSSVVSVPGRRLPRFGAGQGDRQGLGHPEP